MNTPAAATATTRLPKHYEEPCAAEGLERPAQAPQYLRRLRPSEQVEVEGPVVSVTGE